MIVANRPLDSRSEQRFSKKLVLALRRVTPTRHQSEGGGGGGLTEKLGAIGHCGFVAFQLG